MRYRPLESRQHLCPYLPDRQALFEHYLTFDTSPKEMDMLLTSGYRAFGKYVFRPMCIGCEQCVPIRVPANTFSPNKSLKRILKKCSHIEIRIGEPEYTEEKFELYLEHKRRFGNEEDSSEENFVFSFYDPEVLTLEFCYYIEGRLAAVGIVHPSSNALSSVYFMYRLEYSSLSLGSFSVMKEIEHAQATGRPYLYLGYFVSKNRFMRYKASFYPNEVLKGEEGWTPFRNQKGEYLISDAVTFKRFPLLKQAVE